jgi:hypothetical protein
MVAERQESRSGTFPEAFQISTGKIIISGNSQSLKDVYPVRNGIDRK